MKRNVLMAFAMCVCAWTALSADDKPLAGHAKSQEFMRRKLTYSDGILEGLVLERFELVTTNAVLMRSMDLTNVFLALGNPLYREQITNFQAKVDGVVKAAKSANLSEATAAYSQMAEGCVACHKIFRREQLLKSASNTK